jgi:hypothetical protein
MGAGSPATDAAADERVPDANAGQGDDSSVAPMQRDSSADVASSEGPITDVSPSDGDAATERPDAGATDAASSDTGAPDAGGNGAIVGWPSPDAGALPPPDFGPNVLIFDPSMSTADVQGRLNTVAAKQNPPTPQTPVGFGYGAEFGTSRYAYFFKPGRYNADVKIGFYTQALGLGHSPDDVVVTGAVRSKADWRTDDPGDALLNFWRGAENLAVIPTLAEDSQTNVWAVSQGTHLRRIHVQGTLVLSDGGYSSGGFIADSKIDTRINCGTQQQFLCRNTDLSNWQGGSWNMVFVGDGQPPSATWPGSPYTVVGKTPLVREKPFLFIEANGNYYVMVPGLKANSQGPSWSSGAAPGFSVPIDQFYLARPATDTASTINAALSQGKHLILTPGIYHLADSIQVTRAGTIVLGLGLPTVIPDNGAPIMTIADVDGVSVGGIILEAGIKSSPTLLQVGTTASSLDHTQNPTALFDVHCTVAGANPGTASSCMIIHSNNVLLDNSWLWRSDDGAGVGWTSNMSKNGLIVNGNGVTAYGLFVEHFQEYQTLWNGNGGTLYFYQSEMPYDVPAQTDWQHGGTNGYAAYKVSSSVTSHDARGLGVYCVFNLAVSADNAIETPATAGVSVQHAVTARFGGAGGINHIINGTGNAVNSSNMWARTPN